MKGVCKENWKILALFFFTLLIVIKISSYKGSSVLHCRAFDVTEVRLYVVSSVTLFFELLSPLSLRFSNLCL